MGFNLDQLQQQKDLIVLDAREALASFMVGRHAERKTIREGDAPRHRQSLRGRDDCVIRAYGEMVDVLWKDGMEAAAVRLEMLWNQLANTRTFSLLCGYSMAASTKTRRSTPSAISTATCWQPTARPRPVKARGATVS